MHNFKFYGSATVSTKGQIVIPAEARDELHMDEGIKLMLVKAPHHDGLLVLPADVIEHHLADMQNALKTSKDA